MPPRKSNVPATSNGPEDGTESPPPQKQKEKVGIEDLSLPKSMIQRLAKGVLPANTQIQKDALAALHKSATVFVSYIAATANDNALSNNKKTITPQDVIAALKEQEYQDFLPRCEAELSKYNETQCDKRNTYRRKVAEEKKATKANDEGTTEAAKDGEAASTTNGATNGHVNGDDMQRPAKKARGEGGVPVPIDVDGVDEDVNGEHDDDQEADEQDEEAEEEVAEEDDGDGDDAQDETMEDMVEEVEDRGELRDEALDEPDSD